MNLVSNAIKFTHDGKVNVEVTCNTHRKKTGEANVTVSVIDTGIGMDAPTQHRVFDAFTQGDTSTTREYGGTGLG